jgi:vesicle-fusing ATPase
LRIKAAYPKLFAHKQSRIVISDTTTPPKELNRFAYTLPLPPPDTQELGRLFEDVFSRETLPDNLEISDPQLKTQACMILKGLLEHEATLALKRTILEGRNADSFYRALAREKVRALKGSSALVLIEPDVEVDQVGGLDRFKEWLHKRKPLFFRYPQEGGGLLAPKGVLLMGVAGTGKSLCAKVTAKIFGLPLLRLELSALFAQNAQESPDALFLKAIEELEHLQPCVLWVDEIEKGFVSGIEVGGSSSSRISAGFLTWMQERKSHIFVVATANRIMMLPAEILRRGRFDDVFFLDLPELEERKDIFGIQLERFGMPRASFELENLAEACKGFSGAEIEQVVKQALIEALSEERPLTEADLYRSIGAFVPLSVTMFEQIKAIKKWAHDRAIPASSRTRF